MSGRWNRSLFTLIRSHTSAESSSSCCSDIFPDRERFGETFTAHHKMNHTTISIHKNEHEIAILNEHAHTEHGSF
jgi:hypothetical protein